MLFLLSIWLAVGIGLMWMVGQREPGSVGLPLAYFLGLSIIHVPGALLVLDGEELNSMTTDGFEQTVIGMVAFLVGVTTARYAFVPAPRQKMAASPAQGVSPQSLGELNRLALLYMCIGGIVYFAVMPFVGSIPSATALVSPLGSLLLVGACIRFWLANETANWPKFLSTMVLLPLLPLVTLTQGGFLGFGTMWAVTVSAFLFAQSKRKVAYIFAAPAVFFIGLSLFVNYMAAREDIRQLVWYEQASVGDRLQRIANVFVNFEWLDLSNWRHRQAIDGRLNQNFLVGAAAARLESGQVEYASGATLGNMIVALIPRVIWPDKPAVGGGGTVVQDFTGIEFAEGTSVGAGQVLEFYVNFGTWGVIGGFLLFGCLIGRMDLLAMRYLRQGQQTRFLFWFMMGGNLLNPGGNLKEIVVSIAGCAVTAYGLGYLLKRYNRGSTHHVLRTIAGRSGG
jgi:hypothetical protein